MSNLVARKVCAECGVLRVGVDGTGLSPARSVLLESATGDTQRALAISYDCAIISPHPKSHDFPVFVCTVLNLTDPAASSGHVLHVCARFAAILICATELVQLMANNVTCFPVVFATTVDANELASAWTGYRQVVS
jgi:hypothetical protein